MPTNPYFVSNLFGAAEQSLIDSLTYESIKMYGLDVQYVKRTELNEDAVIVDDKLSSFNSSRPCEMFIKSNEGFSGEGDFLSKFGLTIHDRVTLTVSRTAFAQNITAQDSTIHRPMEGDLIFFPLNKKLFQIMFVEHEANFYQTGALQSFDLICELFEFNHETFATGNTVIDGIYQKFDLPYDDVNSPDKDTRNVEIQIEANTFLDWTEHSPFGDP